MKKIISFILTLIFLLFICGSLFLDLDHKKKDRTVKVAEVAHTIFYAPQYVAIEKGFFKDFGINIELILTPGADKVTSALLSNDVDIGFCGSESTIYVYNEGNKDYIQSFAQLTQKDGTFLVSKKKYKDFNINILKGKKIIGGRAFGMPEMTLEYGLKKNGIDPKKDVNIDTSISFAAMSGAFIGGDADFVTLFEPNALDIEKNGYGYILKSVGELGGYVPYTSYSAKKSFIVENKELIKNFNKAIQKGLDYVHGHSDYEIANIIYKQFPSISLSDLEVIINRYRSINVWPKTYKFDKEQFYHLQNIMIDYGAIKESVNYDELIYNE